MELRVLADICRTGERVPPGVTEYSVPEHHGAIYLRDTPFDTKYLIGEEISTPKGKGIVIAIPAASGKVYKYVINVGGEEHEFKEEQLSRLTKEASMEFFPVNRLAVRDAIVALAWDAREVIDEILETGTVSTTAIPASILYTVKDFVGDMGGHPLEDTKVVLYCAHFAYGKVWGGYGTSTTPNPYSDDFQIGFDSGVATLAYPLDFKTKLKEMYPQGYHKLLEEYVTLAVAWMEKYFGYVYAWTPKYQLGDRVSVPKGQGVVKGISRSDFVEGYSYSIQLDSGGYSNSTPEGEISPQVKESGAIWYDIDEGKVRELFDDIRDKYEDTLQGKRYFRSVKVRDILRRSYGELDSVGIAFRSTSYPIPRGGTDSLAGKIWMVVYVPVTPKDDGDTTFEVLVAVLQHELEHADDLLHGGYGYEEPPGELGLVSPEQYYSDLSEMEETGKELEYSYVDVQGEQWPCYRYLLHLLHKGYDVEKLVGMARSYWKVTPEQEEQIRAYLSQFVKKEAQGGVPYWIAPDGTVVKPKEPRHAHEDFFFYPELSIPPELMARLDDAFAELKSKGHLPIQVPSTDYLKGLTVQDFVHYVGWGQDTSSRFWPIIQAIEDHLFAKGWFKSRFAVTDYLIQVPSFDKSTISKVEKYLARDGWPHEISNKVVIEEVRGRKRALTLHAREVREFDSLYEAIVRSRAEMRTAQFGIPYWVAPDGRVYGSPDATEAHESMFRIMTGNPHFSADWEKLAEGGKDITEELLGGGWIRARYYGGTGTFGILVAVFDRSLLGRVDRYLSGVDYSEVVLDDLSGRHIALSSEEIREQGSLYDAIIRGRTEIRQKPTGGVTKTSIGNYILGWVKPSGKVISGYSSEMSHTTVALDSVGFDALPPAVREAISKGEEWEPYEANEEVCDALIAEGWIRYGVHVPDRWLFVGGDVRRMAEVIGTLLAEYPNVTVVGVDPTNDLKFVDVPVEDIREMGFARAYGRNRLSPKFTSKVSVIEHSNPEYNSVLREGETFAASVASGLEVSAPRVVWGSITINKYSERPYIRGIYYDKDNTIYLAIRFPFRSAEEVERSVRHEICEWLRYVVTSEPVSRMWGLSHSDDSLHGRLMRVVRRTYPTNPGALVSAVEALIRMQSSKVSALDEEWERRFQKIPRPEDISERLGDCYALVGRESMEMSDGFVIHGHVENPYGEGVDHAWIEKDDKVWEPVTNSWFDKADFEYLFRPVEHSRYTIQEARENMLETENFGPWDPTHSEKIKEQETAEQALTHYGGYRVRELLNRFLIFKDRKLVATVMKSDNREEDIQKVKEIIDQRKDPSLFEKESSVPVAKHQVVPEAFYRLSFETGVPCVRVLSREKVYCSLDGHYDAGIVAFPGLDDDAIWERYEAGDALQGFLHEGTFYTRMESGELFNLERSEEIKTATKAWEAAKAHDIEKCPECDHPVGKDWNFVYLPGTLYLECPKCEWRQDTEGWEEINPLEKTSQDWSQISKEWDVRMKAHGEISESLTELAKSKYPEADSVSVYNVSTDDLKSGTAILLVKYKGFTQQVMYEIDWIENNGYDIVDFREV